MVGLIRPQFLWMIFPVRGHLTKPWRKVYTEISHSEQPNQSCCSNVFCPHVHASFELRQILLVLYSIMYSFTDIFQRLFFYLERYILMFLPFFLRFCNHKITFFKTYNFYYFFLLTLYVSILFILIFFHYIIYDL